MIYFFSIFIVNNQVQFIISCLDYWNSLIGELPISTLLLVNLYQILHEITKKWSYKNLDVIILFTGIKMLHVLPLQLRWYSKSSTQHVMSSWLLTNLPASCSRSPSFTTSQTLWLPSCFLLILRHYSPSVRNDFFSPNFTWLTYSSFRLYLPLCKPG